jgi:hypothetical protein
MLRTPIIFLTVWLVALAAACSSETSSSSESTCCFNGAFYDCNGASQPNCSQSDTDCARDSSRDDECN